jgi:hypothetical protein
VGYSRCANIAGQPHRLDAVGFRPLLKWHQILLKNLPGRDFQPHVPPMCRAAKIIAVPRIPSQLRPYVAQLRAFARSGTVKNYFL